MDNTIYQFERLSTREGFNRSLSHFKAVSALLDDFEDYINLSDILNDMIAEGEIQPPQIMSIVYALLVDKYRYNYRSYNLKSTITEFEEIVKEVSKWNAVDMLLLYFHPELGPIGINPKNRAHWENVGQLKKDELLTIYAGGFQESISEKIKNESIEKLIALIEGNKIKSTQSLKKGSFKFEEPEIEEEEKEERVEKREAAPPSRPAKEEQKTTVATGQKRMTPMYSVPVTNELFHNGNVEAWKKIIQSYTSKHPDLEVFIFYEGERIHDINTLFKWGKVKHGSAILFAVAGEDIKDVAKLQRYLKQGASPRFEDFLRAPVNQILNLF
ncbi:MAG: hypothetical protein DRP87_01450 [Spirochaetes bacterium]|nr:MAG: hypothetical protein DRP87_01450 [Spirochaetota bacterium]